MRKENKTFSGSINANLNATVGPNGSDAPEGQPRSNTDYAIGYSSAAISLINVAIESPDLKNTPDFLVYPICFNMRHSLELYLKKFWNDLATLATYRNQKLTKYRDKICETQNIGKGELKPFPIMNTAISHDISILWNKICEYGPLVDSRLNSYISILTEFVNDIAELDSTGQTFRYPSNNESEMHLKDTPLINIEILKIRFSFLSDMLEKLGRFLSNLIYEYGWASYTDNLSYYDLYEISLFLNNYNGNEKPPYALASHEIRSQYGISGKEYSKAIDLIKSDRILSQGFMDEQSLVYLSLPDIIQYIKIFFEDKNEHFFKSEDLGNDTYIFEPPSSEDIILSLKREAECVKKIQQHFTLEKLAELHALYNFAREASFHNMYLCFIEENLRYLRRQYEDDNLEEEIGFFLSKTNLVENLISSLWVLNCKDTVAEIIREFDLHSKDFWIKVSSGERYSPFREITSFKNDINEANLRLSRESNYIKSIMLSSHNI